MNTSKSLLSAVVVIIASTSVNANVSLESLIGGATISVGDKLFSDWTLYDNNAGGTAVNLADITVAGDASDPLNTGLTYTAANDALATTLDFIGLSFGFAVTVQDPQYQVNGASLEISDYSLGDFGGISIDEIVFDPSFTDLASLNATVDTADGIDEPTDEATFAPQSSLFVDTSIFVADFDLGTELVGFNQYFSQVNSGVPVPGPNILGLLIVGLLGISNTVSRRRMSMR